MIEIAFPFQEVRQNLFNTLVYYYGPNILISVPVLTYASKVQLYGPYKNIIFIILTSEVLAIIGTTILMGEFYYSPTLIGDIFIYLLVSFISVQLGKLVGSKNQRGQSQRDSHEFKK
jgi:hypothetical protein